MEKLKFGAIVDIRAKRHFEEFVYVLQERGFDLSEIIYIKIEHKKSIFRKIFSWGFRCARYCFVKLRNFLFSKKVLSLNEIAALFEAAGKEIPSSSLLPKLSLKTAAKITYVSANSINDIKTIKILNQSALTHFVLYSSELIKKPLFDSGKYFVLCHPGELPRFRGRDAMIWSLLIAGRWTWSVIYLNPGVDTGDLVFSYSEDVPALHSEHLKDTKNLKQLLCFVQQIYNCRVKKPRALAEGIILIHKNNYQYIGKKQPEIPLGNRNRQYFLASPEINFLAMRKLLK